MFKVFDVNDVEWDEFIKKIDNCDIYLDSAYYKSLKDYCNVKIFLLTYEKNDSYICEVIQINNISSNKFFINKLENDKYFDAETPYGYGGPYVQNATEENLKEYFELKKQWAKSQNIISEFIRYTPLLDNYKYKNDNILSFSMKSTVYIELKDDEELMSELNCKNRNMVRKAIKNGITIEILDPLTSENQVKEFISLYKQTMDRNKADEFYYFTDEYFYQFFKDMKDKCKLFCAYYNNKIIASSLIIYNNKNLHYYLSGSDREFMNLAPNNLLLYEVARWGYKNGFEKFHLGGGVSDNDFLFGFKKQFNEKGILPFYIGREIYNLKKFNYLVDLRKQMDSNFDMERKFLIKYRQE